MRVANKNQKSINRIAELFVHQHSAIKAAICKIYRMDLVHVEPDFSSTITITRINTVDDLYTVTEKSEFKGVTTSTETWKAFLNWSTRHMLEIGGKQRTLVFDTVNGVLYKEMGDKFPFAVHTYHEFKRFS